MKDKILKIHSSKIRLTAEFILKEWMRMIKESKGDQWHKVHARQAFQDSLNAMLKFGLIADYNVVTGEIKLHEE